MLDWGRRLRALGVVGLNARNLDYINQHNERSRFPLVDDKLQTKLAARRHGITTPELLGVIRSQSGIREFDAMIANHPGFAIKPARGSGGKGILVIDAHDGGRFRKASGHWMTRERVVRYLSNLLSGLYTLGGRPDVAVIEALIRPEERMIGFSHEGVPDVRIVIHRGYPVMAMTRLSTQASDGKANLHQGAIGVGLDLTTGRAVHAVQYDRPIRTHPDTGAALDQLFIENWRELLELAAGCYEMSGLGYLGVDMVLDREQGPMLLELNARPGLSIQMANGCGLRPRCDRIAQWERERMAAEALPPAAAERVTRVQDELVTGPGDVP